VIGINAQLPANSGVDGNVGIGFAIPINAAKRVITQLRTTGKVAHAWLGIEGANIDQTLAQNARIAANSGVLIQGVVPASPAHAAKLHTGTTSAVFNGSTYCLGGDVITRVNGKALTGIDQLQSTIAQKGPGDHLKLTIASQDGSSKTLRIALGKQPAQTPQAPSACSTSTR